MDIFFRLKNCERCNNTLNIRTVSKMNTDIICIECSKEEKKHPSYKEACDREHEEVMKGNHYYEGLFAGEIYPFNK